MWPGSPSDAVDHQKACTCETGSGTVPAGGGSAGAQGLASWWAGQIEQGCEGVKEVARVLGSSGCCTEPGNGAV